MHAERSTTIGDVEIVTIPVSHDAAEPCGFHLRTPFGALTVLTDLGAPSRRAAEVIAASDLIVLEANHDEDMLRRGPYAAHLKRRILSDTGHLSNAACGQLLSSALRGLNRVPTIWLAHLSQTNNRPHLAKSTIERKLARDGLQLSVATLPRRGAGPVWRAEEARQRPMQLFLPLAADDDTRTMDASPV
jgi:phosphoribosyl 1,2-cyclic phosphodiesterase